MSSITVIDNNPIVSFLREAESSGMARIRGGTFRMGSDRHCPEEQLVHRVTVQGFWMDSTPVTNRQSRPLCRPRTMSPSRRPGLIRRRSSRTAIHAEGRLSRIQPAGLFGVLAALEAVVRFRLQHKLAAALWAWIIYQRLDDRPVAHVALS
jgi:hypothetical protein